MKHYRLSSVPIFLFVFSILSRGGYAYDLAQLIEEAKTHNPEIIAARAMYEASKQRISPVYSIMDPWLAVEFEGDMQMYSLAQEFPFPTKLTGREQYARVFAEQQYAGFQRVENEVILKLRKAYGMLYKISKEIELRQSARELLDKIHGVVVRNYAINNAVQSDVLRIEIELAKSSNEILNLKDEKKAILREINVLLDRTFDSELDIALDVSTEKPKLDLENLFALAKENNPVLKNSRMALASVEARLSLSKQEYLPDFMVKIEQRAAGSELTDRKYMFGLTIPVWFWGKQRKMVKEMEAEKKMAQADYQTMENMVSIMISDAKTRIDRHQRTIDLYDEKIIPRVKAALESSLRAYEMNKVDFMALLDNEKMLIESELEYYQSQVDYFTALSELEELLGVDKIEK